MQYTRCNACKLIIGRDDLGKSNAERCPNCGLVFSSENSQRWPSIPFEEFVRIVEAARWVKDVSVPIRLKILFFYEVFDVLIEDFLQTLFLHKGTSKDIVGILLSNAPQFTGRMRIFKKEIGDSLENIFKGSQYQELWVTMINLRQAKEGQLYASSDEYWAGNKVSWEKNFKTIEKQLLPAFVYLNNTHIARQHLP